MQIIDPTRFIELGNQLRYLREIQATHRYVGDTFFLHACTKTRESLAPLGLTVSMQWYDEHLAPTCSDLEVGALFDENPEALRLSEEEARRLQGLAIEFEKVVFSEARTRRIGFPTERRYTLAMLLDTPDRLFAPKVFDRLSAVARYDVQQACRAIAFDLPTAAAFHVLRALEECLRALYQAYFKRGNRNRPWGPLVQELQQKPKRPQPDPILLSHLDHLRHRFRNPTDHPEKIYEIDEAQDLFNLCIDAVNRCLLDPLVQAASP